LAHSIGDDIMLQTIKLLIADDNEQLRNSLKGFFEMCSGITVVGMAASGTEAIALSAEVHPEVILMDLRMPGGNGIMATQAIHERYPEIKVIALTSGFLIEAEEALAVGASAYIFKSVSVYDILETIQKTYAEGHSID
jgi:DNA-binding NarL/FixJ family response regulator